MDDNLGHQFNKNSDNLFSDKYTCIKCGFVKDRYYDIIIRGYVNWPGLGGSELSCNEYKIKNLIQ